jgi:hypothetical protein
VTERDKIGHFAAPALLALAAACARTSAPAAAPAPVANAPSPASSTRAGAPCALSGGAGVANAAPRVFIELTAAQGDLMALLRNHPPGPTPMSPTAGLERFTDDPRLERLSVLHVIVPNDTPRIMPWEADMPDGSREQWAITVTPHVNGPAPAGVRVEVVLSAGTPPEAGAAAAAGAERARTTVVVHDQESIVLGGFTASATAGPRGTLVLTPYVLWEEADLWRLYECKRRRAPSGTPE